MVATPRDIGLLTRLADDERREIQGYVLIAAVPLLLAVLSGALTVLGWMSKTSIEPLLPGLISAVGATATGFPVVRCWSSLEQIRFLDYLIAELRERPDDQRANSLLTELLTHRAAA